MGIHKSKKQLRLERIGAAVKRLDPTRDIHRHTLASAIHEYWKRRLIYGMQNGETLRERGDAPSIPTILRPSAIVPVPTRQVPILEKHWNLTFFYKIPFAATDHCQHLAMVDGDWKPDSLLRHAENLTRSARTMHEHWSHTGLGVTFGSIGGRTLRAPGRETTGFVGDPPWAKKSGAKAWEERSLSCLYGDVAHEEHVGTALFYMHCTHHKLMEYMEIERLIPTPFDALPLNCYRVVPSAEWRDEFDYFAVSGLIFSDVQRSGGHPTNAPAKQRSLVYHLLAGAFDRTASECIEDNRDAAFIPNQWNTANRTPHHPQRLVMWFIARARMPDGRCVTAVGTSYKEAGERLRALLVARVVLALAA